MPSKRNIFIWVLGLFLFTAPLTGFGQSKESTLSNRGGNCSIFTPKAFTPNDDGVNDLFTIRSSEHCMPMTFTLKIFDRWGRLVYQTDRINEHWDGNYDGQRVREGVYLWTLSASFENSTSGEVTTLDDKGSIVVLR